MHHGQLRAFVTVADVGSFTTAAATLGLTQSGVSQAVAALEASLGVVLLERTKTGAVLTEIGQRLVFGAREVLARAEHLRQEAAASKGLLCGTVRLGSFASVSASLLPPMLAEFRRLYPGVELVLLQGSDAEVIEWLTVRAVDVGIIALPAPVGLDVTVLGRDEWKAVLPRGHALASRRSVSLTELAASEFVLPRGGCESPIHGLASAAGVVLRSPLEVWDTETLLAMVRQGLGITLAPSLLLVGRQEGLHVVRLAPRAYRSFGLATVTGACRAPAAVAFLDLAAARFRVATGGSLPGARVPAPRAPGKRGGPGR